MRVLYKQIKNDYSFVTKGILSYYIVDGNPVKIIKNYL